MNAETNDSFASWIANEREVTGRCKSANEVLCRCGDYCAYRLGWQGEGWTRELLFCKMRERDACNKNIYEVGSQFTCMIGRLISDERSREGRGIKFYRWQEWGSEL